METNFVVPSSETSRAGASFFDFYDAAGRQSGSTARQAGSTARNYDYDQPSTSRGIGGFSNEKESKRRE